MNEHRHLYAVDIDPTDPQEWGPAVERIAEKLAERMWGNPLWYRGMANDALTTVFPNLDPKDTQRVSWIYFDTEEAPTREELFADG